MKRRKALQFALAASLLLPAQALAQRAGRVYRVGVLLGVTLERFAAALPRVLQAFRGGLRDRGYVEGTNLVIEWRGADGQFERLPGLAAELVALGVDLIVAATAAGTVAAKNATGTIPIVFVQETDPVASGFVKSLARPGGNVTGLVNFGDALLGKQLELLREAVPGISRVAVIHSSKGPLATAQLAALREANATLKLDLRMHDVNAEADLEHAFRAIEQERPQGLQVFWTTPTYLHLQRIVDFARVQRLPAVYGIDAFANAGGLFSYSVNYAEHWRQSVDYVDKILKGAKPADLPVQRPTRLELVVNLKAARAIAIVIPRAVLLRADRVIE